MKDQRMNLAEAAAYLRCHQAVLEKALKRGCLKCRRISDEPMFRPFALLAFWREHYPVADRKEPPNDARNGWWLA